MTTLPAGAAPGDVPAAATTQGGVFSTAQALDEGWTARQIRRRLAAGRWVHVAGDGLAVPAAPWTAFQLAVAARLTWPTSVCSHTTAGRLHDFPLADEQVAHVITDKGHRSRRSIAAHTSLLGPGYVVLLGPLLVTDRVRTAVDCLALLDQDRALDLWAWLTVRQVLTHAELERLIGERRGLAGTARLRTLVRLTRTGAVSAAERRLHQVLQQAGITGWEAGVTVSDRSGVIGVVDLLFPAARVVVEVDGYRAHSGRRAFQQDRDRQNRLSNAGYRVLRFTWHDVTERPDRVVAQIRDALRMTALPPK